MNQDLKNKLIQVFTAFKSTDHMLKRNTLIIQKLHYDLTPELAKAFCLGVVFDEMIIQLDAYYYPVAPDYSAVLEAHEMYFEFVKGKYD